MKNYAQCATISPLVTKTVQETIVVKSSVIPALTKFRDVNIADYVTK